jgi:hypothetical protein
MDVCRNKSASIRSIFGRSFCASFFAREVSTMELTHGTRTVEELGLAMVLLIAPIMTHAIGATRAHAQDDGDIAAAADAYSRAQEAELAHDWERAAELYALANRIAPTPQALRSAAHAARMAGFTATAATYAAELVRRYPDDEESRALGEDILQASAGELGRIEVSCDEPCRVLVDGRLATPRAEREHVVFVRPGDRSVRASFDDRGESADEAVTAEAGRSVAVALEPLPAPIEGVADRPHEQPLEERDEAGLSPWFFGAGLIVTAALGGVTLWSGLDVLAEHEDYDPGAPDAQQRYDDGRALELRTNVLIGVTAGAALATVLLAAFADWDGGAEEEELAWNRPWLSVLESSLSFGWSGRFR